MYARGVIAKGQPLKQLWSQKWETQFFKDTMTRERFSDIIRFIRFDIKSMRSQRLLTDKFAHISEI